MRADEASTWAGSRQIEPSRTPSYTGVRLLGSPPARLGEKPPTLDPGSKNAARAAHWRPVIRRGCVLLAPLEPPLG